MKIVIVGESPANPSGFGQQVLLLVEGFQKHGHEVVCISQAFTKKELVLIFRKLTRLCP